MKASGAGQQPDMLTVGGEGPPLDLVLGRPRSRRTKTRLRRGSPGAWFREFLTHFPSACLDRLANAKSRRRRLTG